MSDYLQISIEQLVPFANHPFSMYEGQRLADLVESVRENGIITPIVVRPIDGGDTYEILSGHNRVAAAKEVGLETVPAIVREGLTDDEAMFIVTETNLIQRSFADMKHSERAVVIAVHYEALKSKVTYRSDLLEGVKDVNGEQVAPRLKSSGLLALQYGLSADTIKRYLRINKLIPQLKEHLDNNDFGIVVGVSLSFLRESEQKIIAELIADNIKIGIRQADTLRKASAEHALNKTAIKQILNPEKTAPRTKAYKVSKSIMSEFFGNGESDEEIENVIAEALRAYYGSQSLSEAEESV